MEEHPDAPALIVPAQIRRAGGRRAHHRRSADRPPAAAADAAPSPKIDSALLNAVDGGGEATFFVMLKDRADLSSAKKQKSHAARAEAAYGELRAHAKSSQKSLSSFLDEEKVSHEGGDRQAAYEVRTARAEFALRARRPDDALRALSGHTGDAPVLVAWAELLSGRPESALRLARAEVARSERTGERLAEVEARIALGVSLSASPWRGRVPGSSPAPKPSPGPCRTRRVHAGRSGRGRCCARRDAGDGPGRTGAPERSAPPEG